MTGALWAPSEPKHECPRLLKPGYNKGYLHLSRLKGLSILTTFTHEVYLTSIILNLFKYCG